MQCCCLNTPKLPLLHQKEVLATVCSVLLSGKEKLRFNASSHPGADGALTGSSEGPGGQLRATAEPADP